MSKQLGETITALLKKNGMTQKELAQRIGTTEATMCRYIAGDREPKAEVLANIATALNVTCDYLLGKEDGNGLEQEFPKIKRLIARNAEQMSEAQKRELIAALFDLS